MIEEKEALETIISTTPVPVSCKIPTEKAYNLHLLDTVKASHSSPKRDQSSMDGFGINVCSKKLLKFEIKGFRLEKSKKYLKTIKMKIRHFEI